MIDFTKSIEGRRQNTVRVEGEIFPIRTEFYLWFNFQKIHDELRKENKKEFDLILFDYLYTEGVPENREAGYKELEKFYLNEQPLPKSDKESKVRTLDWSVDSERICAAFLSHYNINLLTTDLHWHTFNGLFNAIFWPLERVIEARLYEKTTEKYDKLQERISKENREMWRLESLEQKPLFNMR